MRVFSLKKTKYVFLYILILFLGLLEPTYAKKRFCKKHFNTLNSESSSNVSIRPDFPIPNIAGITFSTKDRFIEYFFNTGDTKGAPWSRYSRTVDRRLRALAEITSFPKLKETFGRKLEKYTYRNQEYYGWYSIEVDKQFRIIFRWENNHATDIRIEDYHGG